MNYVIGYLLPLTLSSTGFLLFQQERIKNLEKSKGEVKKEGKVLKDQIDKLNDTIGNLQQRLDAELEEGEQRQQEIDVLKDCILQFKVGIPINLLHGLTCAVRYQ